MQAARSPGPASWSSARGLGRRARPASRADGAARRARRSPCAAVAATAAVLAAAYRRRTAPRRAGLAGRARSRRPWRRRSRPGRRAGCGARRHRLAWAPVKRPAAARSAPDAAAPAVGTLEPRDAGGHAATSSRWSPRADRDATAAPWVQRPPRRAPQRRRPAGSRAPRSAATRPSAPGSIVDLGRLEATLYRGAAAPCCARRSASVRPAGPTPRGEFYVRNRLTRYRSPTYGPVAFGTSARSPAGDRLARRRLRRHPRHRPARPRPRPRLARLHPHAQRRHPRAGAADAGRHAGRDRLSATRGAGG